MDSRTDDGPSAAAAGHSAPAPPARSASTVRIAADAPPPAGRLLVWAVIAVALVVGVVLALVYGPRLTPLLDALH